jgi:predicted dehydrogenase
LDIGVYPLFISLLLLGEPTDIKALFKIGKTGVDESGSVILRYPDNKLANLFFTFLAETTTETDIFGTKGYIRINKPWFIPNSISVFTNNTLSDSYDFNYQVNGYEFEIEEVMKCIQNNKKESDLMPLEFSLNLIRLLDKIRHESGIEYQNDF